MKKKFCFIALSILFLSSCNYTTKPSTDQASDNTENITYTKDHRVNLCFGMVNSMTNGTYQVTSITCVPCDSVKHLLINP